MVVWGFLVCDFSKKMNTQRTHLESISKNCFILQTKLYKIYRKVLSEDQ